MIHRQNNVLKNDANSDPDWAASYTVNVQAVGATAVSFSTNTATVDAGHGFKAGDKVLVWDGTTSTFVAEALTSVTATTLVWTSATPTIASGDLLCNMGPDTSSSSTPAWDGWGGSGDGPKFIASDMDGGTLVTNSAVTTDTNGNYDYWTRGDGRAWELIRTGNTVAYVIPGWGGVGGQINPCDYGCVGDDSTDNAARIKVAFDASSNTGMVFRGPAGDFQIGSRVKILGNMTAENDPNFRLLKSWDSGGGSPQQGMLTSNGYANDTAGSGATDSKIRYSGGRMATADWDTAAAGASIYPGTMVSFWSDDGWVKDVLIEEWGNDTNKGWAVWSQGDRFLVDNVRAYSTVTVNGSSDGIGWSNGDGGKISNCHVTSADDCYTMGTWTSGLTGDDHTTENGSIFNCTGVATQGNGFATFSSGTNAAGTVDNISVSNCHFTTVFSGIKITHADSGATATVKNVFIDNCTFDAATADGAYPALDVNNSIAASASVENLNISNCHFICSGSASAIQGAAARFHTVTGGSLTNCTFSAEDIHKDQVSGIATLNMTGFRIANNRIVFNATNANATTAFVAIKIGAGTGTTDKNNVIIGNVIENLYSKSTGISLDEASDCTVSNNIIRIASGAGTSGATVIGINDGAGAPEGNNVISDNNLRDWMTLEATDNTNQATALINAPIVPLLEGDTTYEGNLGYDMVGFASYTATASGTQDTGAMLQAGTCLVATVASANDAVTLPYAWLGRKILIHNNTANALRIFPAKSDKIESGTTDVHKTLAAGTAVEFLAVNTVNWIATHGAVT